MKIFALLVLLSPMMLNASPQRIITLSPHGSELIHFAGGSDRLIAVSAFSDFPEQVTALPKVASANGFDKERILLLNPDLVIAWQQGLTATDLDWLQQQRFELFLSDPRSLDAIKNEIQQLGRLLGTDTIAASTIQEIENKRSKLHQIAHQRDRSVQVLHLLWHSPLIALTNESMVSSLLEECGITTPVTQEGKLSITLSREQIYSIQLDAIIVDQHFNQQLNTTAVAKMFPVNTTQLHRASPRMLNAAIALCEQLSE